MYTDYRIIKNIVLQGNKKHYLKTIEWHIILQIAALCRFEKSVYIPNKCSAVNEDSRGKVKHK